MGGLGNQLFQYAMGRRLSIAHHTSLKLDLGFYGKEISRKYSLSPFCIIEEFASNAELAEITGESKRGLARLLFRLGQKRKLYYRKATLTEPHFRPYDRNLLNSSRDVYMCGYWQSEKYFVDIKDVIRHEFMLKQEPGLAKRELERQIHSTESVSLHIRRGDYISNPLFNQVHGTCSLEYYYDCIKRMAYNVPTPHFFVFSDDPNWAIKNLDLGYPTTFVPHTEPSRDHEDLWLMSRCKHHIIANSSFSWWGAWLNPSPEKIVYAPRKWFNDSERDTRDLIPDDWHLV